MNPSTLQLKATRLLQLDQRRKAHHRALSSLHASPLPTQEEHEQRGLRMWRRLKRLESEARQQTISIGNGTGLSFTRASVQAPGLSEWDHFEDCLRSQVSRIFGGVLPPGFYVETDWREPALKLERKHTLEAFPTDRAGNGILCGKVSI